MATTVNEQLRGFPIMKFYRIGCLIREAVNQAIAPLLSDGIDVGEVAARNLINHIKGIGNMQNTNTIIIRSNLIIRKSSLKIQSVQKKNKK